MSTAEATARPPRRTQAERRAATIERLVDATITVLGSAGYAAASVKAICDVAGVSQGALFRHFDSRLGLIAHATDQMGQRNLARFAAATADLTPAQIVENAEGIVLLLREIARDETHAAWREVVMAARTRPDLAEAVRRQVTRFEAAILTHLSELLDAPVDEAEEVATVVLSLMHMFDSEAVTVHVKPNAALEARRVKWAAGVLRELYASDA